MIIKYNHINNYMINLIYYTINIKKINNVAYFVIKTYH